jgi:hypothetical protein
MSPTRPLSRALPLWPLPLLAGLLPALGTLAALLLFRSGDGSFCNPFIDDCVSISRMARHGVANQVFRALVLPGAVLQTLTWLAATHIIVSAGCAPRRDALPVALLGACAGVMLVVYASFLGSDGEVYGWLRRWGTLVYFGGTYLAMLFFARALHRLHQAQRLALPRGHGRVMLGLLAFIAVIALGHGFASLSEFTALEDRIENFTEWWGALALTLCFATIASLWSRWGMVMAISVLRPSAQGEGAIEFDTRHAGLDLNGLVQLPAPMARPHRPAPRRTARRRSTPAPRTARDR